MKHEFLHGEVWAMAGGSPEHSALAGAVTTALSIQLTGKPCRVFTSDLRVRVLATGLGTYPDVTVICGSLQLDPDDPKRHTAMNPKVVVEVLSPSTEEYDRGEKFAHYKRIEALEAVVFVAHDESRIDVWVRRGDEWVETITRAGGAATIDSIQCVLDVDALFRDPLGLT